MKNRFVQGCGKLKSKVDIFIRTIFLIRNKAEIPLNISIRMYATDKYILDKLLEKLLLSTLRYDSLKF